MEKLYLFPCALLFLSCGSIPTIRGTFLCARYNLGISENCENDSPLESRCDFDVEYKVQCKNTCLENSPIHIWGTVNYTDNSNLCLAALHDRRISSWNPSYNVVLFKRMKLENGTFFEFHNSISQGIESKRYEGNVTGYFYFTSPRIKEPLLDFISIHSENRQTCRLPKSELGRTIQFFPFGQHTITDEIYGDSFKILGKTFSSQSYKTWENKVGGLQCQPSNNDLSAITTITKRRNADFSPNQLTITVNNGEKVVLTMKILNENVCENGSTWKKDDNRLDGITGYEVKREGALHHLQINSVNLGHAGIYSLQCNQNDTSQTLSSYGKRGFLRLIVRSCPAKFYGDHCNITCPYCQNGGLCHDLLGVCICPPGFTGKTCEYACGKSTFGSSCDQKCYNVAGIISDCYQSLFCFPDPFGCSCASGFKGLECSTRCESGYYGAGCTQKCSGHCAKNVSCDIYTGFCPDGCEEGWTGKACNIGVNQTTLHPDSSYLLINYR